MKNSSKILVSAEPLRELLSALQGPGYLIRELQAIRGLPDGSSPIDTLIKEFNSAVEKDEIK